MDPGTSGYSLRFRVNAIVAALMSLFVIALLVLQIQATRHGVQEEIVGANRVAGQLLERVGWIYSTSGPVGIRGFLWSPKLTLDAKQIASLKELEQKGMTLDLISRGALNPTTPSWLSGRLITRLPLASSRLVFVAATSATGRPRAW